MGQPTASPGPDSEFRDPERRKLMTELLREMREFEVVVFFFSERLTPLAWSCLWLSDIKRLKEIVDSFKKDPFKTYMEIIDLIKASRLVSLWVNNDSTELDGYKTNLCEDRDGKCVITKATERVSGSSIVPHNLRTQHWTRWCSFWLALSFFWDKTNINQWKEFVGEGKDPENFLLLDETVRSYWKEQLFALEPLSVSNDKKTMKLKFFWLCPGNIESLQLSTTILPEDPDQEFLVEPPSLPAALEYGGKSANLDRSNLRLYNCETGGPISSGQIVTLTTEDPVHAPLPDVEFLQFQWLLHRVVALATAAGYQEVENSENNEDNEDDEDYEDYEDYENDEVDEAVEFGEEGEEGEVIESFEITPGGGGRIGIIFPIGR